MKSLRTTHSLLVSCHSISGILCLPLSSFLFVRRAFLFTCLTFELIHSPRCPVIISAKQRIRRNFRCGEESSVNREKLRNTGRLRWKRRTLASMEKRKIPGTLLVGFFSFLRLLVNLMRLDGRGFYLAKYWSLQTLIALGDLICRRERGGGRGDFKSISLYFLRSRSSSLS